LDSKTEASLNALAVDIRNNNQARDHLLAEYEEAKTLLADLQTANTKANISTLAETDLSTFWLADQLVNESITVEALQNIPGLDSGKIDIASNFANFVKTNVDLREEWDKVVKDTQEEVDIIAAYQARWTSIPGMPAPTEQQLEDNRVLFKNQTKIWNSRLNDTISDVDRVSMGLRSFQLPGTLKEFLPVLVDAAHQNIMYNGQQLFEDESNWSDKKDFPHLAAFIDAKTQNEKKQALKAAAHLYTEGSNKRGFTYDENLLKDPYFADSFVDMFHKKSRARLFLDLMVLYRTLESFDPSIATIK